MKTKQYFERIEFIFSSLYRVNNHHRPSEKTCDDRMLYVIGLGLADEKDISVNGLEAVRKSERVYLEAYTSILLVDVPKLEEFNGRSVTIADRDMVETESEEILRRANQVDVSCLVVGDPYGWVASVVTAQPK